MQALDAGRAATLAAFACAPLWARFAHGAASLVATEVMARAATSASTRRMLFMQFLLRG
jgi:hypothetical protein